MSSSSSSSLRPENCAFDGHDSTDALPLEPVSVMKDQGTVSAWLSLLARNGIKNLNLNPTHSSCLEDGADALVIHESVPKCDTLCAHLSPIPVRALVLIHLAIGDTGESVLLRSVEKETIKDQDRGKGKEKRREPERVAVVDVRSQLLAEIVDLPESVMQRMKSGENMKRTVRLYDHVPAGQKDLFALSLPSKQDVEHHYSTMRAFYMSYVLSSVPTFYRLMSHGADIQKALCEAAAWLFPEICHGCMNFRLQQSFSKRVEDAVRDTNIDLSLAPLQPQHRKRDLHLSLDERLCLVSLGFTLPTTVEAIKPMLKHVASRYDPEDPMRFHAHSCRELHPHPELTLQQLYEKMWVSCMGSIELQIGGWENLGDVTTYENVKGPEVEEIDEEVIEEVNRELEQEGKTETPVETVVSGGVLPVSSVHNQAEDLWWANRKQHIEQILKAPALGSIWTVHFADRAERRLRRYAKKNLGVLVYVLKNIMSVSNGLWTSGVACPLVAPAAKTTLYECKVANNLRVVWQVDVAFLEDKRCYSQVIKVWSVGNHQDVIETIDYVCGAHKAYNNERVERCKTRRGGDSPGLVVPTVYSDDGGDSKHIIELKDLNIDEREDSLRILKMHEASVTAKFIPFSKMFMRALVSGTQARMDLEFPFAVSEQEYGILNHNRSVIVIGRSGTGKTSCSVFRLLSHFHARRVEDEQGGVSLQLIEQGAAVISNRRSFRQIFVTASPKFCGKVQTYFKRLQYSVSPGDVAIPELESFLEQITDLTPITEEETQHVEALVDEDLSNVTDGEQKLSDGASFDDEGLYASKLPRSFGDLEDSDFPLFVHYKKLVSMLRVYLDLKEDVIQSDVESAERNVDFERFAEIFASIDSKLTQGIDVALAFTEIMGVIKGHQSAAGRPDGKLSREQYYALSSRAYATFTQAEGRKRLYDVFEAYNAKKLERFQLYINGKLLARYLPKEQDELDRVNEVNRTLREMLASNDPRLEALYVNEVYLDEVQDLTMCQILPVLLLCKDPEHGLMFAGDTAQVIHRGSVFRFQDLSSMIYEELKEKKAITAAPKPFQLTKNYRSHDGILAVAASMLDLLREFFPASIDNLPAEKGMIAGPQPVIAVKNEKREDIVGFLGGGKLDGEPIEFGAGQVILVRTLEDIKELKATLKLNTGEGFALIMTVEQAKGMEFRDVVLYNLIAGGPASSQQWRVVLNMIPDSDESCPAFSSEKHNVLATEFKILYTAITRARSKLWIWDFEDAKSKKLYPLFKFWRTNKLVIDTDDELSGKFSARGQDTTPEEWNEQGRKLMDEGLYENALGSFRRELRTRGKPDTEQSFDTLRCEAFIRRTAARQYSINSPEAKKLFLEAGDFFRRANALRSLNQEDIVQAARCYESSEKLKKASEMYELVKTPQIEALNCFRKVSKWALAGKVAEQLGDLTGALKDYMRADACIMEAVKVVAELTKLNKAPALPTIEKITTVALANHRLSKAEKLTAIEIIPDNEVKKGLFRSQRMFGELAKLFIAANDRMSAGRVHERESGNLLEAAKVYKDANDDSGRTFALLCLARQFWNHVTPGIEALFCGDSSKISKAISDKLLSSNGILWEVLDKALNSKGKLSTANSSLIHYRWVELGSIDNFIANRRPPVNIKTTADISEIFMALKLAVTKRLMNLTASAFPNLLAMASRNVEILDDGLHLLFIFRILVVGLGSQSVAGAFTCEGDFMPSLFSEITRFPTFLSREILCEQVEKTFCVSAGLVNSECVCYRTVFEPHSFEISKNQHGITLDAADRCFLDSEVFYALARTSLVTTAFNLFETLVKITLKSAHLGSLCSFVSIYNTKCYRESICPDGHVPKSEKGAFEDSKLKSLTNLVRISMVMGDFVPSTSHAAFEEIKSKLMTRTIQAMEPWDNGHHWSQLPQTNFPKDVQASVLSHMENRVLSVRALTYTDGCFDLNSVLNAAVRLGPKNESVITAKFVAASATLTQKVGSKPQMLTQTFLKDVLPLIYSCATTKLKLNFLSHGLSILGETCKLMQNYFTITGIDSLCYIAEMITAILLTTTRAIFTLPWRMISQCIDRFPDIFAGTIDLAYDQHVSTAIERLEAVFRSFKSGGFSETFESGMLRLRFSVLLLNQYQLSHQKKALIGLPSWMKEREGWKVLKALSHAGCDELVFVWRDTVKPGNVAHKEALAVSSKYIQLGNPDTRDSQIFNALLKVMDVGVIVPKTESKKMHEEAAKPAGSGSSSKPAIDAKTPKADVNGKEAENKSVKLLGKESGENFSRSSLKDAKSESNKLQAPIVAPGRDSSDDGIPELTNSDDSDMNSKCLPKKSLLSKAKKLNLPARRSAAGKDPLLEAAEVGDAEYQYKLGLRFAEANDSKQAYDWFAKAAQQKHAGALARRGDFFYAGGPVERNYKMALECYIGPARDGNAEAMLGLGRCYREGGYDVARNMEKALKWFKRAAEDGNNAEAQFLLAGCFANGEGVAKNPKFANELYEKAAAQGHEGAITSLEALKPPKPRARPAVEVVLDRDEILPVFHDSDDSVGRRTQSTIHHISKGTTSKVADATRFKPSNKPSGSNSTSLFKTPHVPLSTMPSFIPGSSDSDDGISAKRFTKAPAKLSAVNAPVVPMQARSSTSSSAKLAVSQTKIQAKTVSKPSEDDSDDGMPALQSDSDSDQLPKKVPASKATLPKDKANPKKVNAKRPKAEESNDGITPLLDDLSDGAGMPQTTGGPTWNKETSKSKTPAEDSDEDFDDMPALQSDSDSESGASKRPASKPSSSTASKHKPFSLSSSTLVEQKGSNSLSSTSLKQKPVEPAARNIADDDSEEDMPALMSESSDDAKPNMKQVAKIPEAVQKLKQKPTSALPEESVDPDTLARRNAVPIKLIAKVDLPRVVARPAPTQAEKARAVKTVWSWWRRVKARSSPDALRNSNRLPRICYGLRQWPGIRRPYLNKYLEEALPVYLELSELYIALGSLLQVSVVGDNVTEANLKVYYEALQLRDNAIEVLNRLDPKASQHQTDSGQALTSNVRKYQILAKSIKELIERAPKNLAAGDKFASTNGTSPRKSVDAKTKQAAFAGKARRRR